MKAYDKYANDVLGGKIIACNNIKLACVRYEEFKSKYHFDEERVDRVIKFISLFKHYSGKSAGKQFVLMDWQQFLIANIYGFYEGDRRVCNSVYLQISRKSGKSFLAAALALYSLLGDNEADPQILFTATSFEQANICFGQAKQLALQLDRKEKYYSINKSEVILKKQSGRLKVMASDATKMDGWSPSVAIIDEYHAHRTSEVRDVMISGQGARANPLEIIITTAGFNIESPCKIYRDVCLEVLNGYKIDDSITALIYELDDNDDWENSDNWIKSCPCMGVTIDENYIQRNITKAKNNPSELVPIKTKILNLWCDSAENWIPSEAINNSSINLTWDNFRGHDLFIGVDLSAVSDLTAVSFSYINVEGKVVFKTNYYLPRAALDKKGDIAFYKECIAKGDLIVTDGNVVDYRKITADINTVKEEYGCNIMGVAYDKYNATQWALEMQDEGYNLIEFSQSLSSFNRPTKELERLIMSNQTVIDDNRMTKYCFKNVVLKYDYNNNCKPDKSRNTNKIDGTISMCQCIGGMLFNDYELPSIYTI